MSAHSEIKRLAAELAAAKFWQHVKRGAQSECWEWTGYIRSDGYGQTYVGGFTELAHRVSYALANGPIPQGPGYHGWIVMHLCDNRKCCNPSHFKLGTNADNVKDMFAKGRRVMPKGAAHHNAAFTDEQVNAIRNDTRPHSRLAEEHQTSPAEIAYIRQQGWAHIKKPAVKYVDGRSLTSQGETNPNARLNADIVRAIRASKDKPGKLAVLYGIKPDTVTKVRHRLSWAHVED